LTLKRVLSKIAIAIGFVVTVVTLAFAVGKIRKRSEATVRDLEVQKGIEYSREEFLRKTEEIMQGVVNATSEEIMKRWLQRFGIE